MRSITPVVHENATLVVFAEKQPEYDMLIGSVDADGCVMTEWEASAEDLAKLMNGGRLRLWLMHTGIGIVVDAKLTPIALEVIE